MPHNHMRALFDITACRTEKMGGHLEECDRHCGHFDYVYHSCKNRSCPKCHGADTQKWLAKRESELLPVPYFHLVFTLPSELREVVRGNQKALYAVLFEAAIAALSRLGIDRKYLGGQLGMVAVLHTWTRAKEYHPHLHLLVPGGALDKDGTWRPARRKFLVPVKALSPIFRALFMKRARKALPTASFPGEVWEKDWVVFSRPTFKKTKKVLSYLSRYVYRVAITNNSIIALEKDYVTFRYQNSDTRQWKTMRLPATGIPAPLSPACSAQGIPQGEPLRFPAPDQQEHPAKIAIAAVGKGQEPDGYAGAGNRGQGRNRKALPPLQERHDGGRFMVAAKSQKPAPGRMVRNRRWLNL